MANPVPYPDSDADGVPLRPDERSDLEQIVQARSDAVDRGEGGPPDEPDGVGGKGGAGGVVKNQDDAAQ